MAVPGRSALKISITNNLQENESSNKDFRESDESDSSFVIADGNRCHCSISSYKKEWIKTNYCRVVDVETCECPSAIQLRKEENVLLNTVSVNRGIIHKYTGWSIPRMSYLIGIPFGWLLLGMFQYFVCVIVLGDSFLDPQNFTCAWIVEVICTIPITIIITIIKCLYVRVDILEYCEKITWTGFTFIIFQGLAIILLLLPISNFFKYVVGDFSRPINFFIYWMIFAFPHIMILCFATFGCCSKMFQSFSRHFRCVYDWDKQEHNIQIHLEKENYQKTLKNDNNIELQDLNYCAVFRSN